MRIPAYEHGGDFHLKLKYAGLRDYFPEDENAREVV